MTENRSLLPSLIIVSKIDAAIAAINAERKKIETAMANTLATLKKEDQERQVKAKSHDEKKARYTKEEKRLRDEREKLVARRKALTTLSNYKLQQAAEKEIEHASRQITAQEEASLSILEEVESLGVQIAKHQETIESLKDNYKLAQLDAKETFVTFEERLTSHYAEREEAAKNIDPKAMNLYDRIREKFVMDPVVEVVNGSCIGCYMQIGPQVVVQIGRGDTLTRCPGCGRILYLAEAKEAKETAA